jgi:hypothetical protein
MMSAAVDEVISNWNFLPVQPFIKQLYGKLSQFKYTTTYKISSFLKREIQFNFETQEQIQDGFERMLETGGAVCTEEELLNAVSKTSNVFTSVQSVLLQEVKVILATCAIEVDEQYMEEKLLSKEIWNNAFNCLCELIHRIEDKNIKFLQKNKIINVVKLKHCSTYIHARKSSDMPLQRHTFNKMEWQYSPLIAIPQVPYTGGNATVAIADIFLDKAKTKESVGGAAAAASSSSSSSKNISAPAVASGAAIASSLKKNSSINQCIEEVDEVTDNKVTAFSNCEEIDLAIDEYGKEFCKMPVNRRPPGALVCYISIVSVY